MLLFLLCSQKMAAVGLKKKTVRKNAKIRKDFVVKYYEGGL